MVHFRSQCTQAAGKLYSNPQYILFLSICLLFSSVAVYYMLVTCHVTVYRSLTHVPACGYHLPTADLKSLWGIGGMQCSLMLNGTAEGSNVKGAGSNIHACTTLSSVFPLAIQCYPNNVWLSVNKLTGPLWPNGAKLELLQRRRLPGNKRFVYTLKKWHFEIFNTPRGK